MSSESMDGMEREPRLQAWWAVVFMGWLTVVLWLDSAERNASLDQQRLLGLATWLVLIYGLSRVSPLVRAQTMVVVAFATAIEFLCSPYLEVYLYRFHNVPTYVPPGHGLVYLSAFALGHALWVRRHERWCVAAVTLGLGIWALVALLGPRTDVLGAMWWVCLVVFLWIGPSRPVYLGAGVVVTYLELVGTELRNWVWQPQDPFGWISIGNPPTGAAGGYGWFDLAGLLAAPWVLGRWYALRGKVTPGAGPGSVPAEVQDDDEKRDPQRTR